MQVQVVQSLIRAPKPQADGQPEVQDTNSNSGVTVATVDSFQVSTQANYALASIGAHLIPCAEWS